VPISSESLPSCLVFKNVKIKVYKTIILPAVFNGCKMVFHVKGRTQTDGVPEQMLRIFRPERGGVTGGWRNLNNEELYNCGPHHILFKL
jgi:hypothetical protein